MSQQKKRPTTRVSLDLTPRRFDRLQQLAKEDRSSKAGVLRDAIDLYEFIMEKAVEGCQFYAVKDKEIEHIVVLGQVRDAPSCETLRSGLA